MRVIRSILLDFLQEKHPLGIPENDLVTETMGIVGASEETVSEALYELIGSGIVEWEAFEGTDPLVCRLSMQRGGTA